MLAWILPVAMAATPRPDRPLVTRTGALAEPYTLEMELGATFADGPTRAVPAALKYSIGGVVEPRIMTNLGAYEAGTPGLELGIKVRMFASDDGTNALAMWVSSRVPMRNEAWRGQWHALFTTQLAKPLWMRVNGGLDFVEDGEGSLTFGGTPLTWALVLEPTSGFDLFAELAGRAGGPDCEGTACAYGDLAFSVGAAVAVTPILVVDAAVGYSARTNDAIGTVGLTSNFGGGGRDR